MTLPTGYRRHFHLLQEEDEEQATEVTLDTINQEQLIKLLDGSLKLAEMGLDHSPIFIWGPPGIGKTQIITDYAEERGIGCVVLMLNQLDTTDLKGIPIVNDERSMIYYVKDQGFPRDPDSIGILFIDEANTGTPEVANAAMRLFRERRIDDYTLPKRWIIVAAGNGKEDQAFIDHLSSPMANRFIHFEMRAELEPWLHYASARGVDERITGFLAKHPDYLHNMHADADYQQGWASPRSWCQLDHFIKAMGGFQAIDESLLRSIVCGAVGLSIGNVFIDFLDHYELWMTPEVFFEDRDQPITVPKNRPELRVRFFEAMGEALIDRLNRSPNQWSDEDERWLDGLYDRLPELSDTELTLFVNPIAAALPPLKLRRFTKHARFDELFNRQGFQGLSDFKLSGHFIHELTMDHRDVSHQPSLMSDLINTYLQGRSRV